MAFKFINRLISRKEKTTQSMIQPNDTLNVNNISQYTQIVTNKEKLGYKGLKLAFDERLEVSIIILDENGERCTVKGKISHFDEKYEQLLIVTGSSLKRVVFNQIIEVDFEHEGEKNQLSNLEA